MVMVYNKCMPRDQILTTKNWFKLFKIFMKSHNEAVFLLMVNSVVILVNMKGYSLLCSSLN